MPRESFDNYSMRLHGVKTQRSAMRGRLVLFNDDAVKMRYDRRWSGSTPTLTWLTTPCYRKPDMVSLPFHT